MKVLDTNTLTHLFAGHARVIEKQQQETDEVAAAVISWIEILQGRFAMLLKAANGQELRRAQQWLDRTMEQLADIPKVLPIDEAAAAEFDRLR
jgi:tRNA(fMet)-specific endonuclease VapC